METETEISESQKTLDSYIQTVHELDLVLTEIDNAGIDDANVETWITDNGLYDLAYDLGINEDELGTHHILDRWIENNALEVTWTTKHSFYSEPEIATVELLMCFGGPNVWLRFDLLTGSSLNCEVIVRWWNDNRSKITHSDYLFEHVKDLVESGIYCA